MQMNQIIKQYQGDYDKDVTATENSKNWSEDPKVILLTNQDNKFDMEQKTIETELNALQKHWKTWKKHKKLASKTVLQNWHNSKV